MGVATHQFQKGFIFGFCIEQKPAPEQEKARRGKLHLHISRRGACGPSSPRLKMFQRT